MKKPSRYLLILFQINLLFFVSVGAVKAANDLKSIEKKITKIIKDKKIPSLELTITTENDALDFSYNHKKVKKQKIFGIGSTTKMLSAVLIFKLIEDKKLNLTDKVTDYVKLNREIEGFEKLTVKNLLNHTSGLSDYTQNPKWMKSVLSNKAPQTFKDKIVLIEGTTKKSGSFSYSNTNYLLLQEIVETITERSYEVFFNEFYKSNDLSNIKIGIDESDLQGFFGQTKEGSSDVSAWREYYGYDGGAFAETKTLDSFLTKLYRKKSILKSDTLSQMEEWIATEPMTIPIGSGKIAEYGYGVMKLEYDNEVYLGHFGSTLKYQSLAIHNPKKNISISIATNCSGRYFNNVFFQELIPAILDEL